MARMSMNDMSTIASNLKLAYEALELASQRRLQAAEARAKYLAETDVHTADDSSHAMGVPVLCLSKLKSDISIHENIAIDLALACYNLRSTWESRLRIYKEDKKTARFIKLLEEKTADVVKQIEETSGSKLQPAPADETGQSLISASEHVSEPCVGDRVEFCDQPGMSKSLGSIASFKVPDVSSRPESFNPFESIATRSLSVSESHFTSSEEHAPPRSRRSSISEATRPPKLSTTDKVFLSFMHGYFTMITSSALTGSGAAIILQDLSSVPLHFISGVSITTTILSVKATNWLHTKLRSAYPAPIASGEQTTD